MDFCAEFSVRYPHITNIEDVERIVNKAKFIYYASKFPHETSPEKDHPITTFMQKEHLWQIADELTERLGFNTALGYRENGVNWTFDEAWISRFTQKLLTPRARTISIRR